MRIGPKGIHMHRGVIDHEMRISFQPLSGSTSLRCWYVRVCNHSSVDLVHVSDIELLKQNPYWKRFTQRDYLPKQCGGCAQAVDCDGGCREASHVVGGAVDSPDPLLVQCGGGLG